MSEKSPNQTSVERARKVHDAAVEAEEAAGRHDREARLAREGVSGLDYPTRAALGRAIAEHDRKVAEAAIEAKFTRDARVAAAAALAREEALEREAADVGAAAALMAAADKLKAGIAPAVELFTQALAVARKAIADRDASSQAMREAGKTAAPLPDGSLASALHVLLERRSGDLGPFSVVARVHDWLSREAEREADRKESERWRERDRFEAALRGACGPEAQADALKQRRQELAAFYGGSANSAVRQLEESFAKTRLEFDPLRSAGEA